MNKIDLASVLSMNNKTALNDDTICGCFSCLTIFNPKEIIEWCQDVDDETALCPYCGIDSVIGESAGLPITIDFLKKVNKEYFDD